MSYMGYQFNNFLIVLSFKWFIEGLFVLVYWLNMYLRGFLKYLVIYLRGLNSWFIR